jgi:hypothetical protein
MASLSSFALRIDAYRRLGFTNVARVAAYRVALRLRIHPVQHLQRDISGTEFFRAFKGDPVALPVPADWGSSARYFGWFDCPLNFDPPDWHLNPIDAHRFEAIDQPWWTSADFATGIGDIKTVWEASRFDWVVIFAQRVAVGESDNLRRLNTWLTDWALLNPAYMGLNWKCGQEASIRVMHLALAARLLGQLEDPTPDLVRLVEAHLARIEPTLSYALAQDNNHGTSEAAGLFIGGAWLRRVINLHKTRSFSGHAQNFDRHRALGRRWLENRVARLIEDDGTFSQYSTNYHRLMLDTLCLAELARRWLKEPRFSDVFYSRAKAATLWLQAMTGSESGDAPNLGANDGANLLPLTNADYRDYRPTVELARVLFAGEARHLPSVNVDNHVRWLGLGPCDAPNAINESRLRSVTRGYMVLAKGPYRAIFRYPHYRFRPSHCDALHLDVWVDGENVLRDDGSYSYNADPELLRYFGSTRAHNTVEFDDRDMMPKVSRFLRGAWLRSTLVEDPREDNAEVVAAAAYRDWQGASHERRVIVRPCGIRVSDKITGFKKRAVLRWRLSPGEWITDGSRVRRLTCDTGLRGASRQPRWHSLEVTASVAISSFRIVQGWESRHYLQKTAVPVLEVEVNQPGEVVSEYRVD